MAEFATLIAEIVQILYCLIINWVWCLIEDLGKQLW